ncbi:MAG: glycosyltransferase, partial [Candidatus Sumerlaeia bacterium]|nr:glycosyltransferase [Candidatus Sumerlaeia bacterium]
LSDVDVKFTGKIPHKQVFEYLKSAHAGFVLLQPTNWRYVNSEPIKMFEYSAMKKPIIAPDYPAIRHFFPAEAYCLLFPPEDISAIEERIIKLISDTALRTKIGKLNYERLLSGFTPQHYVEKVENIISKLLS